MKVRVFGGLYHGRVLVLPEGTREGDIVPLPETLPGGETWAAGRSNPEDHASERTYVVRETQVAPYAKYLALTERAPRTVRTVEVPPAPTVPITVHLS